MVAKPLTPERDSGAARRSRLRKVASIAESVIREAGWFALSGRDDSEVRTVAACVLDAVPGGPIPLSGKTLLSRIVERCLVDAGIRVLVGASPSFAADGPELFAAAQDAVALASGEHPMVVLEPSVRETPADRSSRVSSGGPVVEKAIEFLHSRFSDNLSLSDVAAAVSCSPFHMSRLFRLTRRDTFVRYFTRMRVEAAKALLRSDQYSVKEIGAMVGLNDPTYFARCSRNSKGRLPPSIGPGTADDGRAQDRPVVSKNFLLRCSGNGRNLCMAAHRPHMSKRKP
jgi:AraC-like DNA-binding protein